MSFKEVYSKANDDLHGNPEVLEKILSSARKKDRYRIPVFIPVAAMAAMLAMIIAVPYMTGKITPGADENIRVVKKEMPPVKEKENSEPDAVRQDIPETASESVIPYAEDAAETLPEESVGTVYEYNDIIPEEPVADAAEAAAPETLADEDSDVWAVNYAEQLAGAEASVMMSRDVKPTREMSSDEYAEFIGKDIEKAAVIPEDMTMEAPSVVIAEIDEQTGDVVSEKATYFAHSGDYERFAEINVTRTQNILIPEEGMEKSEICGNTVIVLSDNIDFNASFSVDEVQYFIRSGGVTETEFKNLLISLNGGNTNEQEDFSRSDVGSDGGIVDGNADGISG